MQDQQCSPSSVLDYDPKVKITDRAAPFRPIVNPIHLLFLRISKGDPRLAAVCSDWAKSTQVAFGVFVLFTATLAFGAAYYTLSTLGAPHSLVPWIATGWAIFVLFLDREIAGSLDKRTAAIRPFLALFIGTLAAIPIELWVFQGRTDQELQREYIQNNSEPLQTLHADEAQLDQRRLELNADLRELQKQEAEWGRVLDSELVGRAGPGRTGIAGAGPVFENAQRQQTAVRERIQEVRGDMEKLELTLPREGARLHRQFEGEELSKVTDFVTRYEAMDKVVHSSPPLYRLSWLITLAMILVEMTPALMKLLSPHVDYHHLVSAEIRENIARIDEIADRNYRLAIENPEQPHFSVSEKFAKVRYAPVQGTTSTIRKER